ncbi:MAG: segregation/condensation protein A [Clostridiales bacterium]|nr:segregation/condensation protein A [Clostridiales bacterium]
MSYQINLEVFEGPFDLLFHLIEKNEVDIYDIPIHEITKQYIDYLNKMQAIDMDLASEFIVMAATLLEIKSKMLLPSSEFDDISSEMFDSDPRKELVSRLIEYRKYREASEFFASLERNHSRKAYREGEDLLSYFEKPTLDEINNGLETDLLVEAMKRILSNLNKEDQKRKTYFNALKRDLFSVEDKIKSIQSILLERKKCLFIDTFSDAPAREEVIVSFLAILELLKLKFIGIEQEKQYSDIVLFRKE